MLDDLILIEAAEQSIAMRRNLAAEVESARRGFVLLSAGGAWLQNRPRDISAIQAHTMMPWQTVRNYLHDLEAAMVIRMEPAGVRQVAVVIDEARCREVLNSNAVRWNVGCTVLSPFW